MIPSTLIEERIAVIETVMGRRPPTVWLKGGQVFNVYTGRLEKQDVWFGGDRIAYVGSREDGKLIPGDSTEVVDVSGAVLIPGYIEPHSHPFQFYNPVSLTEKVLPLGTTAMIHDNLYFFRSLDERVRKEWMDRLLHSPVHHYWWARLDPQAHLHPDGNPFSLEKVSTALEHPATLQAGELTDWMALLDGDPERVAMVETAHRLGKRVEGHSPGASYRTLSRLAAAGVTGDHESITVEEVHNRLRLGYMTTLRFSSLRPDLPDLIRGLLKGGESVPWHRLMMTTDGPTPPALSQGYVDAMIRVALEAGCPPEYAYPMVTLNPAVYYGLDSHIGGIAPGRSADINILQSLEEPTPLEVFSRGRRVARDGRLTVELPQLDWNRFPAFTSVDWRLKPEDLELSVKKGEPVPVIQLVNPVITHLKWEEEEIEDPTLRDERLFVTLVDPAGRWATRAFLRGFGRGVEGLASSYNGSGDLLVLGQAPEAMAHAANRVLEAGGGIAWIQGGKEHFFLPLPIGGKMSDLPVDELVDRSEELVRKLKEVGHPFHDPIYTFMFLSSTHLPQVRLTCDGLMRIKDREIVVPSVPLT
ncbi:adenine deaminase C-terminal domain-containing protein [Desmospora profundinema]|uniref:adenine deaminase n=1 Tax=Desmospora profundinema TaxID=1571184 RepID=A0ABU1IM73_9BACL|nr:adenine deaminase C-terminal domain-containing protein [Desmospora profundinema]MDR6225887.1 adenine deaminase [Desmospora profundinema]